MGFGFEQFKDISTLIGVCAAVIAGAIAFYTYRFNRKQKQFEFFYGIFNKYVDNQRTSKFREWFITEENSIGKATGDLTEDENKALKDLEEAPPVDKYYLLAFFEQVAIALHSGLINIKVAHHMFGYFSILSFDSTHFWKNMPGEKEDDQYWKVYKDFVQKMRKEALSSVNPEEIKF